MVGAAPASAQAPPQDRVTGDGVINFSGPASFTEVRVDARSGPSGEAPSGNVSLALCGSVPVSRSCFQGGPVTCLNVTGNRAVFAFDGGHFSTFGPLLRLRALFEVVDNGSPGAGRDTVQIVRDDLSFVGLPSDPPDEPITDCPASLPGDGTPLYAGGTFDYDFPQDYVVTDAPPTTYTECRQAGWVKYGFASHAACIDYVLDLARRMCIWERVAGGITRFRAKYGLGPNDEHAMRRCVRLYTGF
jgi:hypothetical protein